MAYSQSPLAQTLGMYQQGQQFDKTRQDNSMRNLLNMAQLFMKRNQEEEQFGEQQAFKQQELGLREQEIGQRGRYYDILEQQAQQPTQTTQTTYDKKVTFAQQALDEKRISQEEFDTIATGLDRGDLSAYNKFMIRERKDKKFRDRIADAQKAIDRRIGNLRKPLSQAEVIGKFISGDKSPIKTETEAIANLESAYDELSRLDGLYRKGQLTPKLSDRVDQIIAGIKSIEKKGVPWKTAAPKFKHSGTVNESSLPTGTEVFMDETSGKEYVEINGQWKLLIKNSL